MNESPGVHMQTCKFIFPCTTSINTSTTPYDFRSYRLAVHSYHRAGGWAAAWTCVFEGEKEWLVTRRWSLNVLENEPRLDDGVLSQSQFREWRGRLEEGREGGANKGKLSRHGKPREGDKGKHNKSVIMKSDICLIKAVKNPCSDSNNS